MNKRFLALAAATALALSLFSACRTEAPSKLPEIKDAPVLRPPIPASSSTEILKALSENSGNTNSALLNSPDIAASPATIQFVEAGKTSVVSNGYLYVLSNSELKVLRAGGTETELLATVSVSSDRSKDNYEFSNALYISDDRLVIVSTCSNFSESENGISSKEHCIAKIYDISNPAAPRHLTSLGQDGIYQDSAVLAGVLYLISTDTLYRIDENDASTYLPHYSIDGADASILPDRIYLGSQLDAPAYSIISAISLDEAQHSEVLAFAGAAEHTAIDQQGIYLTRTAVLDAQSDPYEKDQYTVTDHMAYAVTQVQRLSADTELTLLDNQSVSGRTVSSNALHIENGTLRLVTATETARYQIFADETYGWSNRLDLSNERGQALTVLDSTLQYLSETDVLLPDASISSVSHLGSLCLFATYDKTQPLAAFDLSTPTAPAQLSVDALNGTFHLLFPTQSTVTRLSMSDGNELQLSTLSQTDGKLSSSEQITISGYSGNTVNLSCSPDGSTALVCFAGETHLIRLSGQPQEIGQPKISVHSSTQFLFDGNYLYTCSPDTINVVDLSTAEVAATLTFGVG